MDGALGRGTRMKRRRYVVTITHAKGEIQKGYNTLEEAIEYVKDFQDEFQLYFMANVYDLDLGSVAYFVHRPNPELVKRGE